MPHSRNNGCYHFVWSTWDQEPLLTEAREPCTHELIRRQCVRLRTNVLALNGIADHVHPLTTLPTTLCIADFMEAVKGASARGLNDAYASPTFSFKWQGGYNYDTVSASHVSRVTHYIEGQKQHHAEGTLWPS